MADSGLPAEAVEVMSTDPGMLAVAPTMAYDVAVMAELDGGTIPRDLARTVGVPTLVVAGGASPQFFRDAAEELTRLLPDATYRVLEGQDHGAPAGVVAPVVAEFLAGSPLPSR
jgi:pimeloyl-ACP methyl ester carboxylesterase